MARTSTKKPAAEKPVSRRRVVANTLAAASGIDHPEMEHTMVASSGANVIAQVPRGFTLTLDDHTQVPYAEGVHEMPHEHANHWFAKAQGVTIFKGGAKAA